MFRTRQYFKRKHRKSAKHLKRLPTVHLQIDKTKRNIKKIKRRIIKQPNSKDFPNKETRIWIRPIQPATRQPIHIIQQPRRNSPLPTILKKTTSRRHSHEIYRLHDRLSQKLIIWCRPYHHPFPIHLNTLIKLSTQIHRSRHISQIHHHQNISKTFPPKSRQINRRQQSNLNLNLPIRHLHPQVLHA